MKTAEDIIKSKGQEVICVGPDTTIFDALKIMCKNKIGAILIRENGNIVGIWTERDLMRNTITPGFDPKKAIIKDYMSTNLKSAAHTDNVYILKDKFLGLRLRHLLVEKEGRYIGLLSIGDVIKASLNEKTRELQEMNAKMSWEYYENWRWKKK